jgi:hypothetical protein
VGSVGRCGDRGLADGLVALVLGGFVVDGVGRVVGRVVLVVLAAPLAEHVHTSVVVGESC